MTHFQIIISIIIGAGILGGLTNFFMAFKLEAKKKECWINLSKALLLSLCASITVPLFLQIISNNLIDIPVEGEFADKNYFVLAGFCVLAAFYSQRFLDDLYAKASKAEQQAAAAQQAAERAESSNHEIDNIEDLIDDEKIKLKSTGAYTNDDIKIVIKAIVKSKYNFRTVKGIATETKLSGEKVESILELLENNGYAERKQNKKGVDVWKIVIK